MDVLIQGQEKSFIMELKRLCEETSVRLLEEEGDARDAGLLVTDFPVTGAGKGIFSKIPFLVVSKIHDEETVLRAFRAGALDYMQYPVSPKIARARILRIVERLERAGGEPGRLQGDLSLTPNERKILSYFIARPGRAVSRSDLIEGVFSGVYEGYDRNVDNYVKQIRRKLADGVKTGGWIETVHGVGYRYLP